MVASVLSFKEGLSRYEGVNMVRIVSKDYNLLIMEDYMPAIGEVEGTVEIVTKNGEETASWTEVSGYFMHRGNQFKLLITGEDYVG